MKKLLFNAHPFSSRFADITWLLFRLHLGLSIAVGAGWSKLVHLTTTHEAAKLAVGTAPLAPPDWFVQQVANLGFTYPSPYSWAWLAAWGECVGGLLVAVGLLTRWNGLQLAFQFLIIAFLWYKEPELLVGMYYQQLLFWAFALTAAVGGGRYSLDYWMLQKRGSLLPDTRLVSTVQARMATVLLLLVAGSVAAHSLAAPATVTMQELKAIAQQWNGSLTYLDYKSQRAVTLVTVLNGMQSAPQELVLNFVYQEPNGKQVKGYDKVQLSTDGTQLVWDGVPLQVSNKTRLPDKTLQLVLEGRGEDNQKSCLIKRTLSLNDHQFSVVKEVKCDNAPGFITRNKYQFQR
ncbi:DoxX family protein [Hymenobacter tibetensis]|uniref:DoxX family protein n=1 Tax=Hymenobacter tibetensis TaxID=497967 RepID=A0ABY4D407_9BACT|nr:DoxX family protein [Hymenobacter tibetensis]UOG76674.1 DoxX family protein [Hymenobacter tibetensis]